MTETATAGHLRALALLLAGLLLGGCGGGSAAGCAGAGAVAIVDASQISTAEYRAQLGYTLGFYEHGNPRSKYFGKRICGSPPLKMACRTVKRTLLQHMIDQQVVSDYAAAHGLVATPGDWARALARESKLIRESGGQQAFLTYLKRVGIDQAQFRLLESQQIETAKVIHAVGAGRFRSWLAQRERSLSITRCPDRTV